MGRMTFFIGKNSKALAAAAMALVYFFSNVVAAHATENRFWDSRRQASKQMRGEISPLYAAATGGQSLLAQMPRAIPVGWGKTDLAAGSTLGNAEKKPFEIGPKTGDWLGKLVMPYGHINDVYVSPIPNAPMVVHIQDAHGIEEAQKNISAMLGVLQSERHVNLVGLEGASGSFNVEPLRHIASPVVTEAVADFFLKKGLIAGPEFAGLTLAESPTFYGAEDNDLYQANIKALKDAFKNKPTLLAALGLLDQKAGQLKKTIFSDSLKTFDQHFEAYKAQHEKLGDYVRYLAKQTPRMSSFPNVHLLARALDHEDGLDFKEVEFERRRLVEVLVSRLPKTALEELVAKSVDYRAGRLDYGAYNRHLRTLCAAHKIRTEDYGQFHRYINYVLLADQINLNELMTEMDLLETAVQNSLVKTPEEKSLMEASRDLSLVTKLMNHEMALSDWIKYEKRRPEILHLGTRLATLPKGLNLNVGSFSELTAGALKPFEDFCSFAVRRNAALAGNLLARMSASKTNAGVLVTGGFHTEGLTQILRQKHVSYVVVTPKISEVSKDNNYLDVLARDPVPLEKLLAGDRIFLVHPVALVRAGVVWKTIEGVLSRYKSMGEAEKPSRETIAEDAKIIAIKINTPSFSQKVVKGMAIISTFLKEEFSRLRKEPPTPPAAEHEFQPGAATIPGLVPAIRWAIGQLNARFKLNLKSDLDTVITAYAPFVESFLVGFFSVGLNAALSAWIFPFVGLDPGFWSNASVFALVNSVFGLFHIQVYHYNHGTGGFNEEPDPTTLSERLGIGVFGMFVHSPLLISFLFPFASALVIASEALLAWLSASLLHRIYNNDFIQSLLGQWLAKWFKVFGLPALTAANGKVAQWKYLSPQTNGKGGDMGPSSSGKRIISMSFVDFLHEYSNNGFLRPGYFGYHLPKISERLNTLFGHDGWSIKHFIGGQIVDEERAFELYEEAYYQYFQSHPGELDKLLSMGSNVYDTAPSNVESGEDYAKQGDTPARHLHDIAIRRVVRRLGRHFEGQNPIQVRGRGTPGEQWSPGVIPFHDEGLILQPELKGWWKPGSIESFFQSTKVIYLTPNMEAIYFIFKFAPLGGVGNKNIGLKKLSSIPWMLEPKEVPRNEDGTPRPFSEGEIHHFLNGLVRLFGEWGLISDPKSFKHAQDTVRAIVQNEENRDIEAVTSHVRLIPFIQRHLEETGAIPIFLARDALSIAEFFRYVDMLNNRESPMGVVYQPGIAVPVGVNSRREDSDLKHLVKDINEIMNDCYKEIIINDIVNYEMLDEKSEFTRTQFETIFRRRIVEKIRADSVFYHRAHQVYQQFRSYDLPTNRPFVIVDTLGSGKSALFVKVAIEYFMGVEFADKKTVPRIDVLLGANYRNNFFTQEIGEFYRTDVPREKSFLDLRWPFEYFGIDEQSNFPEFYTKFNGAKAVLLAYLSLSLYNQAVLYNRGEIPIHKLDHATQSISARAPPAATALGAFTSAGVVTLMTLPVVLVGAPVLVPVIGLGVAVLLGVPAGVLGTILGVNFVSLAVRMMLALHHNKGPDLSEKQSPFRYFISLLTTPIANPGFRHLAFGNKKYISSSVRDSIDTHEKAHGEGKDAENVRGEIYAHLVQALEFPKITYRVLLNFIADLKKRWANSSSQTMDGAAGARMLGNALGWITDPLSADLIYTPKLRLSKWILFSFPASMGFFLHAYQKEVPRVVPYLVERAKINNTTLTENLQSGITQFVNLAAGLDTLFENNKELIQQRGAKCFAVDLPSSWKVAERQLKQARKEKGEEVYPRNLVNRIEADLNEDDWFDSLIQKGLDADKPAVFLLSGLLMYLEPEKAINLLGLIQKKAAPGSKIVFDFLDPVANTDKQSEHYDPDYAKLANYTSKRGEPFKFGSTPEGLIHELEDRGYIDVKLVDEFDQATFNFKEKNYPNVKFAHIISATVGNNGSSLNVNHSDELAGNAVRELLGETVRKVLPVHIVPVHAGQYWDNAQLSRLDPNQVSNDIGLLEGNDATARATTAYGELLSATTGENAIVAAVFKDDSKDDHATAKALIAGLIRRGKTVVIPTDFGIGELKDRLGINQKQVPRIIVIPASRGENMGKIQDRLPLEQKSSLSVLIFASENALDTQGTKYSLQTYSSLAASILKAINGILALLHAA